MNARVENPPTALLHDFVADAQFVAEVPISFARKFHLLAVRPRDERDRRVIIATCDESHWEQRQMVSRILKQPCATMTVPPDVLTRAIDQAYEQRCGQAQEFIESLDNEDVLRQVQALTAREDLLDNAARAPVIKLVNLILFEAAKAGASDVHVQPYEDRLMVRMRIDGVLYDAYTLPKPLQEEVISRVKVMGRMNIAEKRLSQDGRTSVQIGQRAIDLRIASLPTSFGERVVIRLLDKASRLYDLTELGMDARSLSRFARLIAFEHGLILVTGPTGSGKSTTLYSALSRLNGKEKNILTLEDPIEYRLEGISQTQVSEKKGMTFAKGLRSVLRQDPDIIMVGEIRDLETATMAIQSSLTGHLVFSTLHTNDAASAVTRLLDLGIEPYLVASSLMGVLAQRLVRRICPECSQPHTPGPAELAWLRVSAAEATGVRMGPGCEHCRDTGYRGRVGIFELLELDDQTRRLIGTGATAAEIKRAALSSGMRTLRDDGVLKVLAGQTTVAEVERVTMDAEETPVPADRA